MSGDEKEDKTAQAPSGAGVEQAEAKTSSVDRPDVYDELEEIETLTNAGFCPGDVDRYLIDGPSPDGLRSIDDFELTMAVQRLQREHPDQSATWLLEKARETISDPSDLDPWGDVFGDSKKIDIKSIQAELLAIEQARASGDKEKTQQLLMDYVAATFAGDESWRVGPVRVRQLVHAGLATQALDVILATKPEVSSQTDTTEDPAFKLINAIVTGDEFTNLPALHQPVLDATERFAKERPSEDSAQLIIETSLKVNAARYPNDPVAYDAAMSRAIEKYTEISPDKPNYIYYRLLTLGEKKRLGQHSPESIHRELEGIAEPVFAGKTQDGTQADLATNIDDLENIAKAAAAVGDTRIFEQSVQRGVSLTRDRTQTAETTNLTFKIDPLLVLQYRAAGGDVGFAIKAASSLQDEMLSGNAAEYMQLAYSLVDDAAAHGLEDSHIEARGLIEQVIAKAYKSRGETLSSSLDSGSAAIALMISRGDYDLLTGDLAGNFGLRGDDLVVAVNQCLESDTVAGRQAAKHLLFYEDKNYRSASIEALSSEHADALRDIYKEIATEQLVKSISLARENPTQFSDLSTVTDWLDAVQGSLTEVETQAFTDQLLELAHAIDSEYYSAGIFNQIAKLSGIEGVAGSDVDNSLKHLLLTTDSPLDYMHRLNMIGKENLESLYSLNSKIANQEVCNKLVLYMLKNRLEPEKIRDAIDYVKSSTTTRRQDMSGVIVVDLFRDVLDKENSEVLQLMSEYRGVNALLEFELKDDKEADAKYARDTIEELMAMKYRYLSNSTKLRADLVLDFTGEKMKTLRSLMEVEPLLFDRLGDFRDIPPALSHRILEGMFAVEDSHAFVALVGSRIDDIVKVIRDLDPNFLYAEELIAPVFLNQDPTHLQRLKDFADTHSGSLALLGRVPDFGDCLKDGTGEKLKELSRVASDHPIFFTQMFAKETNARLFAESIVRTAFSSDSPDVILTRIEKRSDEISQTIDFLASCLGAGLTIDSIVQELFIHQDQTRLEQVYTFVHDNATLLPLVHSIPNFAQEYLMSGGEKLQLLSTIWRDNEDFFAQLVSEDSSLHALSGPLMSAIMIGDSSSELIRRVQQRQSQLEELLPYINGLVQEREFTTRFLKEVLLSEGSEKIDGLVSFVHSNQKFFDLFSNPESVLYPMRDGIVGDVLLSQDLENVEEIYNIFTKDDSPMWVKLYKLAELRYLDSITGPQATEITYPVRSIPLVVQSGADRRKVSLSDIEEREIRMVDIAGLPPQELRRFLSPDRAEDIVRYLARRATYGPDLRPEEEYGQSAVIHSILQSGAGIPFSWLRDDYRRNVFAYYLRSSVERSIGSEYKAKADERNRSAASPELQIPSGSFAHGTGSHVLGPVLALGNFCGEALEFKNTEDMTPLQVDLSILESGDGQLIVGSSAIAMLDESVASQYADDLLFVFDRSSESLDGGQVHRDGPHRDRGQVLMLAGVPATDVRAIVLRPGEVRVEDVARKIVANGFYIPVYDHQGKLVFSPEEFDAQKAAIDEKLKPEAILDILSEPDFRPLELIDTLSVDPELGELYSQLAGVWERYTIRQHTEAVLGQFEKYFADSMDDSVVDVPTFRMVLALHDIGKPKSVQETGGTAEQHRYTREIVQRRAKDLGIPASEVAVALEVVSHDYLGEYLQGRKSTEEMAAQIVSSAENLGVSPSSLLDLLRVYYLCDASSYTANASYTKADGSTVHCLVSLDHLFVFSDGRIDFSPENARKIAELSSQVAALTAR